VLLHLSLNPSFRLLIAGGYSLSLVAILMHLSAVIWTSDSRRKAALMLITVGFAILMLVAMIALAICSDRDKRGKTSRMLGAMCSALFAMSFVHLGSGHPANAWSQELVLHHAGIPLALFVLLQDYRFVLLDAFVRFLTNVLLAAILTFVVIRVGSPFVPERGESENALYEGFLLTGLTLLLILFAVLRTSVQRWLTKAVFRRPDLDRALQGLRSGSGARGNEADYLPWAAQELAAFMSATGWQITAEPELRKFLVGTEILFPTPVGDIPVLRTAPNQQWAEAIVPLRLAPQDTRYILLGRRKGGRRYLSEDLQALNRLAAVIVEQVERFRETEMQRLVSQAELRALQSQINPHFLFNALNTLYGIIPREASGARRTVMNLAEIFRYSLQSDKELIPLSEELEIVKAYLEIEALRLGSRLHTDIDVDPAALSVKIPILSIQPLVENAIKHGVAVSSRDGWLRLKVSISDSLMRVAVEDTGPGISVQGTKEHQGAGIGLANVSKRLKLCYGPEVGLGIDSDSSGTRVQFGIPLKAMARAV
jgi:signal transduction histidine kinase